MPRARIRLGRRAGEEVLHAVKAQTGKKITAAEAVTLVADA